MEPNRKGERNNEVTDENQGGNKEEVNNSDKPIDSAVKGDISLDGKVSVTDLSQLKSHIISLSNLEGEQEKRCDINLDGKVSILDLSILKMILVGFDV